MAGEFRGIDCEGRRGLEFIREKRGKIKKEKSVTHVADVVEKGTVRRGCSNLMPMLKDRCIELNGSYSTKEKESKQL